MSTSWKYWLAITLTVFVITYVLKKVGRHMQRVSTAIAYEGQFQQAADMSWLASRLIIGSAITQCLLLPCAIAAIVLLVVG